MPEEPPGVPSRNRAQHPTHGLDLRFAGARLGSPQEPLDLRERPLDRPKSSTTMLGGAERGDRNLVMLAANRITLGLPCEATRCLDTIPRTAAEGEGNPIGELGKRT